MDQPRCYIEFEFYNSKKNELSTNGIYVVSLPPYNDDADDDDDYDEELPQHDPWGQKKVGRDKP